MPEFRAEDHLTVGSADEAERWVDASALPDAQKADLRRFVAAFPDLEFVKEDDTLLDHIEEVEEITLPEWFRAQRTTLAFVSPPMRFRVDDYEYVCPRSDVVEKVRYELRLGYADEEQRDLFFDEAKVFPIGSWWGTDRSYLAIDLEDPSDERVFEFASQDLLDNSIDGRPVRGSVYPIFDSFPQLLAHIIDGELPDGRTVRASR
jgi:hypothetical protein